MNQHGVKTYSSVVLVAGMCWLLYWFVEKYLLYWGLEYSGDVFLHTQISKSFYEGKGLFYDNIFAPASHIHNYFVLLLLAPFTFTWGALGLPLAHALINLWAFWYLLGTFKYDKTIWIGAVAFFLGPIAFWLTDDPAYGWHSELLFFPFSVLFACALVRQSPLAYLFGLLLTLNREDGPIVACAVHSVVLLSAGKRDRALLLRWLKVVALWVVIFALGMLFLKIVGDGANTRQGKVVQMGMRAWGEPELRNAVLEMLGGTLLLLLSGSLLLFVRGGPRVTGVVLLCGLPVLLVSLIASFAYLPKIPSLHGHGTSWPYRFGMLWSLLFVGYISGTVTRIGKYTKIACVVTLLALVAQYYALIEVRGYSFIDRVWVTPRNIERVSNREQLVLTCLAEALPEGAGVITSGALSAYFSKFNWSYGGNTMHAKVPADVVVCDASRFHHDNQCREEYLQRDKSEWQKREVEQLFVAVRRNAVAARKATRTCLKLTQSNK